jgi:hypothetical protein
MLVLLNLQNEIPVSQDGGRSPGAHSNSFPVKDQKLVERACRLQDRASLRSTTDEAIAADYKVVPGVFGTLGSPGKMRKVSFQRDNE